MLAIWILQRKMKVLYLIRKENKSYAEFAKISGENKFSTSKIVNKEICASFAAVPQTAKVVATVCDKCLVKMAKALNSWVEVTNRNLF